MTGCAEMISTYLVGRRYFAKLTHLYVCVFWLLDSSFSQFQHRASSHAVPRLACSASLCPCSPW